MKMSSAAKNKQIGRSGGSSYYVVYHFCITSTVILSSNDDSDFFRNQKEITTPKMHRGKQKILFLIDSLMDYLV